MPLNDNDYRMLVAACQRRWGREFHTKPVPRDIEDGLDDISMIERDTFDARLLATRMELSKKECARIINVLTAHDYVRPDFNCYGVTSDGRRAAAQYVHEAQRIAATKRTKCRRCSLPLTEGVNYCQDCGCEQPTAVMWTLRPLRPHAVALCILTIAALVGLIVYELYHLHT